MRQLCTNLDALEALSSPDVRTAVELIIDTGRRPNEICKLPWQCLDRESDGSPVLVYDNTKNLRHARRLPIPVATAALIIKRQQRARFPDTPADKLKLFPATLANPHGTKATFRSRPVNSAIRTSQSHSSTAQAPKTWMFGAWSIKIRLIPPVAVLSLTQAPTYGATRSLKPVASDGPALLGVPFELLQAPVAHRRALINTIAGNRRFLGRTAKQFLFVRIWRWYGVTLGSQVTHTPICCYAAEPADAPTMHDFVSFSVIVR
ncbi:hypothetical protein ABZT02_45660 [Streptomyces sp. NPDC005402]|uniref:hypothetical protein n=1 Tax=Streptomyces sp. NPDC005402 TaxID=3155338 RepID=UPI0033A52884